MLQGKKKIVRSSIYKDYLVVEGLGSTDPVTIDLYVVDHSENSSAPVTKTFTPDIPSINAVFATIELNPAFQGVNMRWSNPLGLELGVLFLAADSFGVMKQVEKIFRADRNLDHTFRGFTDDEHKFGISLSDKWGNITDTFYVVRTPLYETRLNRLLHAQYILPLDNTTNIAPGITDFAMMFDDITMERSNFWHTDASWPSMPFHFTLDLGVKATLSRFVFHTRKERDWEYTLHSMKEFEIWGLETEPPTDKPDAYWQEEWKNDWKYFGYFVTEKPSGNDNPEITAEDIAFADRGWEYDVPLLGPVRYLRFAAISTWGNTTAVSIQELQFFGDDR